VWSWKDTINRLQHIDKIINQIVRDGLIVCIGIFALFCLLLIFLSTQVLHQYTKTLVFTAILVIICISGMVITLKIRENLARQEYYRQWYFHLIQVYNENLPVERKIPLVPSNNDDWIPENRKKNLSVGKKGNWLQYIMESHIFCLTIVFVFSAISVCLIFLI